MDAVEDAHIRGALHKPEHRNAQWLNGTGVWIAYALILVFVRFTLIFLPSQAKAWTVLNVLHCGVCIYSLPLLPF